MGANEKVQAALHPSTTTEYTPTDADELARVLHAADCGCGDYQHFNDVELMDAYHREADAVLSSDWLVEHDRETRDEALVEAAAKFEGPDRFIRAVDVRRRLREGATR